MKLYYTLALGVGRLLQVIRREERSNMMAPWDFGTETLLLYQSLLPVAEKLASLCRCEFKSLIMRITHMGLQAQLYVWVHVCVSEASKVGAHSGSANKEQKQSQR